MTDNEITTEELLSMRVVPEQQADLAVVQDALGTQKADPTDELRRMTYQRDAWRDDALAAEQRIDALKERLADRDASLAAVEAALAQLTGITPLAAAPVGGQAEREVLIVQHADFDTEAYAWAFNEGYNTAQQHGIGGAETRDWAIRTVMAIFEDADGTTPLVAEQVADALLSEVDFSAPEFVGGQAEPSDAEVRAYWDEHAQHTNPESAAAEWEAVRAGLRAADAAAPCTARLPGALVGNTVPCVLDRGHGGEHSAWYGVAR